MYTTHKHRRLALTGLLFGLAGGTVLLMPAIIAGCLPERAPADRATNVAGEHTLLLEAPNLQGPNEPNGPDPNQPDPNEPDPNGPDPNAPDPNQPQPPRITCPDDLVIDCDAGDSLAALQQWLANVEVQSDCNDLVVTHDFAGLDGNCQALVTWTASDACGSASCSAMLSVIDTTPPTITLNGEPMITLECGEDRYVDPGATADDSCDPNVSVEIGGDNVDVTTPGVYVVAYTAKDACGNGAEAIRTVEVVDTQPPEAIDRGLALWPPNHQYVTLNLSDCAQIVDACAGELDVDALAVILSITSDEPDDVPGLGDGNTTDDIVILGRTRFMLRAERQGWGNGRVYRVHSRFAHEGEAMDGLCHVNVPHDQSGEPAVDDRLDDLSGLKE